MRVTRDTVRGRGTETPVDCRPAFRQIHFRGKYDLSLHLSLQRVRMCLLDDPAVQGPRSLLVAAQTGEKADQGSARLPQGSVAGGAGRGWNWQRGWVSLLDQPVPKWTLRPLPSPLASLSYKDSTEEHHTNVDNYFPMWQKTHLLNRVTTILTLVLQQSLYLKDTQPESHVAQLRNSQLGPMEC